MKITLFRDTPTYILNPMNEQLERDGKGYRAGTEIVVGEMTEMYCNFNSKWVYPVISSSDGSHIIVEDVGSLNARR